MSGASEFISEFIACSLCVGRATLGCSPRHQNDYTECWRIYSERRWRGPASSCACRSAPGQSCAGVTRRLECVRGIRHVLYKAWAAYHIRRRIWATPGCFARKMLILQFCVFPCSASAAGTRHWTQREPRQLRAAQAWMTHRQPWHAVSGPISKRATVGRVRHGALWRRAGHAAMLARREPQRCMARASPISMRTVRCALARRNADPRRLRRLLGKRRCDDAVHHVVVASAQAPCGTGPRSTGTRSSNRVLRDRIAHVVRGGT